MQSSPPVHLNTFRKVKVVWGQMVLHTTVVSLFGRAWEGRGLSLPRSTYKQQLVFTATFPISAEGRSCNSHFIALRGHVKDKARSPVNKTNLLIQTLWSLMEGCTVSFKGPLRTPDESQIISYPCKWISLKGCEPNLFTHLISCDKL